MRGADGAILTPIPDFVSKDCSCNLLARINYRLKLPFPNLLCMFCPIMFELANTKFLVIILKSWEALFVKIEC